MPKRYAKKALKLTKEKGDELAKIAERVQKGEATIADIDKLILLIFTFVPILGWGVSPYIVIRAPFWIIAWAKDRTKKKDTT